MTPFPDSDIEEEPNVDNASSDSLLNLVTSSHVSYEQYYNQWVYLGTAKSKLDYSGKLLRVYVLYLSLILLLPFISNDLGYLILR